MSTGDLARGPATSPVDVAGARRVNMAMARSDGKHENFRFRLTSPIDMIVECYTQQMAHHWGSQCVVLDCALILL